MNISAIVAHGAGDLRMDVIPLREPGPTEAVVRVALGGICGSDLHYRREGRIGESIIVAPLVLGHEVVGHVVRPAADGTGPVVGTPVFVHPATTCGLCESCSERRSNLCPELRYLGSAATRPHTAGAFAELIVVPAGRLMPIDGLDLRDAVLIEPAAVAWHAIARALGVGFPEGPVAVVGCGPIGLLCVAVLVRAGRKVIAIDTTRRPLDAARRLGARETLLAQDAIAGLARLKPALVIESSGTAAGFNTSLTGVRHGGTVVAVGQLPPRIETDAQVIVTRELTVAGSSRFAGEAAEVIAALRDRSLDVTGIVTHVIPASSFSAAFDLAQDAALSGKVVLDFS